MATRRARIKAVAALPVRRKNVDNKKPEQNESKEHCEKNVCSPNTSKSSTAEIQKHEKTSPTNKNVPKSPRESLRSTYEVQKTPKHDKTPSPSPRIPTPVLKAMHKSPQKAAVKNDNFSTTLKLREFSSPTPKPSTTVEIDMGNNSKSITKFSEKVPVITSTSQYNKNRSLFASPLSRIDISDKKHISSALPSPSIPGKQIDNTKARTPQIQKAVSIESGKIGYTQNLEKENDVSQDYNPPSVPESITDEGMDGIVPLQLARSVPKPIDILKNAIISESAEVLFDPIVPLPSPSKVRPKLKPVPRLAPFRRNSIQGSASESEDENRRALLGAPTSTPARQRHDSHTSHSTLLSGPNRETNRNRNDSVCSSVSQMVAQPPFASSPLKDKYNLSKSRRQEMMNRRMAAMKRRRETVKRDALTMYDLIFYNPATNPIVPDQDEVNAKEANARDAAEASAKELSQIEEESVDDPPAATPVPQIKLGPNGEIILDETSLTIKQTEGSRKLCAGAVREGAWGGAGGAGGGRYSRAPRTADWSPDETVRFYRALAAVGTDFSLMAPLFPDRNRKDLKLKFKKEERLNGAQVDKALRSATAWDVIRLQKEFKEERETAAKRAAAERDRLTQQKEAEKERLRIARKMRMRPSRGSKAIEAIAEPDVVTSNEVEPPTADGLIKRALEARERKKQRAKDVGKIVRTGTSENATPQFAALTVVNKGNTAQKAAHSTDMATAALPRAPVTPLPINSVSDDIETGSLVVLTVNDPKSPSKQMFQTYISLGQGKLTPVALAPNLLNSVLGYMKKGTPKSNVSSPQLTSPISVTSNSGRTNCATPSVIQVNPSPAKKMRDSPYNITQL